MNAQTRILILLALAVVAPSVAYSATGSLAVFTVTVVLSVILGGLGALLLAYLDREEGVK